jgi:hypothetical protein
MLLHGDAGREAVRDDESWLDQTANAVRGLRHYLPFFGKKQR